MDSPLVLVWKVFKVFRLIVDLNALLIRIVQVIWLVSDKNAEIHALDHVLQAQCAQLSITPHLVLVLTVTLEIHSVIVH